MRNLDSVEIPCGQGGLNASKSPYVLRDTDLVYTESLTYEHDTWEKEGGAVKFNSVAVTGDKPSVRSMHHFRGSVHELVVATMTGRLVVVGSGGITKTIATDSSSYHGHFVEGYNGTEKALYYFGLVVSVPLVYTLGASSARVQLGSPVGTVTADSTTETFTRTAHGLTNNTQVFFTNSGGALPGGIAESSKLYVVNAAANTFQVSPNIGGAAVNVTSNGTGTHTVHRATMPSDWVNGANFPRWGFMHNGRMWAGGGGQVPHAVYSSVLNNHNDYINSGSLYFQVYPGEGDIIIGGISWRGKAYLFKFPYGIYVLDDDSLDTADWGWKRVSRYVGAIAQASIVEADDEVYFVSPDGFIHALSAVQQYGDVQSSAVKGLEIGPYINEFVDFSKLSTAAWSGFASYPTPVGVYYPTKRKLMFGFSPNPNVISGSGFPTNHVLIGFDLHRSDTSAGVRDVQPFVSTRDEYESLAIYRDPTTADPVLLAGSSNGFIYRLDQPARSKDGVGYMARFETKEFLPTNSNSNVNMKELEVIFSDGSSNNSVVMKVYQNGILSKAKTLTDTDRWMRLDGDALKIKIVGENDTLNSSFSIAKIIVRFTQGNWRKHQ